MSTNTEAGQTVDLEIDGEDLAMFHGSPDAIVILKEARKILDVNRAFCRLFGVQRIDVIGQPTRFLYPSDEEYNKAWEMRRASFTHNDIPATSVTMRRADGSNFPAFIVAGSLRDENDQRLAIFCTIRDMSDQVAREASLLAEREALYSLYTRTPALLHSIDREGRIVYVSDEWLNHFGYTNDEVVGQYWRSFLTEPSRRFSKTVVGPEFWRTGRCHKVPFEMITHDGKVLEVELSAVRNSIDGVETSLSVIEDVTARNIALRAAKQQNAALRDFAAFASHDLQSPLRHIQLFSEQLEEVISDSADGCEIASQIREKAALAQEMIKSLLDFSRAAYGGFERKNVDLEQAVSLAIRMVESDIAQSGATVDFTSLPSVSGDLNLLARVFQNLIANSIKHGGVARPAIRIEAAPSNEDPRMTTVIVSDNGVGITEIHSERAFAAYETLEADEAQRSGTGLGLSICRQIVNSHGGEIWVESGAQKGTKICFSLNNNTPDQSLSARGGDSAKVD